MHARALLAVLFVLITAHPTDVFAGLDAGTLPGPQAADTDVAQQGSEPDRTITRMSQRDRFRVSIRSESYPIPLSQMHSWSVHIETPEGNPVTDADIGVFGSMPAHKHGLPSRPRLTENRGGGDYLIEGVKFTMPGEWQLILIITVDGKRDKATFRIDLP
jgi:hypothetical protein